MKLVKIWWKLIRISINGNLNGISIEINCNSVMNLKWIRKWTKIPIRNDQKIGNELNIGRNCNENGPGNWPNQIYLAKSSNSNWKMAANPPATSNCHRNTKAIANKHSTQQQHQQPTEPTTTTIHQNKPKKPTEDAPKLPKITIENPPKIWLQFYANFNQNWF